MGEKVSARVIGIRILIWVWYIALVLVTVQTFKVLAPWSSALHVPDAEQKYHRDFPDEWKAVVSNHGEFREEPLGTPGDHPGKYAALACLLFVPHALTLIVGFYLGSRRARAEAAKEAG